MYNKSAKLTRQSPLQKALGFGEGALRVIGTAKGLWDAGQAVYGAAQTIAPYAASAAAAVSLL